MTYGNAQIFQMWTVELNAFMIMTHDNSIIASKVSFELFKSMSSEYIPRKIKQE